jgi:hypothetical protein
MKITKENYNELKKKELENNYAKVWHVNEIREELLANTPTGGVTEITNTDVGYSGQVTLKTSDYSIISADNGVAIQDNGVDGFNLISKVPYHEVIGSIYFGANQGTVAPALDIQVNTALADYPDLNANTYLRANWGLQTYSPGNGTTAYRLRMTNFVSNLYGSGIFNTSLLFPNAGLSSGVPFELTTISLFDGIDIKMCATYLYISGSDIKREMINLNNNPALTFQFHLILPIVM